MDGFGRPDDSSSEGLCNHLVAKAYAEHGDGWMQLTNDIKRTPGLARSAWTGRDNNRFRRKLVDPGDVNFRVAHDERFPAQSLEVPGQVVDKAVVVIDK